MTEEEEIESREVTLYICVEEVKDDTYEESVMNVVAPANMELKEILSILRRALEVRRIK